MIRRRVSSLLLILLLALPASASDTSPSVAAILCYHIVESPSDTKFSLSREVFEQQMNYLASAGYNVVPLADLSDYLAGKRKSLPPNAVVVTIDDGWKCTYTEIFPVMKRLGLPFTVFVYPKFVGQSKYALTWNEIREMSEQGVDIQSHSLSHPFLTQRRHRALEDGQYSDWLSTELVQSRKLIEQKTGKRVRFLAYPYGDFDSRVIRTAEESGYEAAVTAVYGTVHRNDDRFRLHRVVLEKKISFADFRHYIGTRPLKLASTSPAAGSVYAGNGPVIAAKIADFKELEPGSIGMAVLSLGSTPIAYNPADGTVSLVPHEPFKSNHQQVIVWGKEKKTGRRLEATWSFYANELPPKPAPRPVVPVTPAPPTDTTMTTTEPAPPPPPALPLRNRAPR